MDEWNYQPARDLGLPESARLQSLRREVGLAGATSCLAWRWLMRSYLAGMHRLEMHGREHLPAEPSFVLVANHSSHLDAVTLASAVPVRHVGRVFPIAAGDTFFTKAASSIFATACMNALPIWRKNCGAHSLDDLRARLLEDRCIYIIFPEGTRTRTGQMAPFKPGLGRLVAGTGTPVVPCHLAGAWEALPPERKLPRARKITLRIGAPLSFAETSNDRDGWNAVAQASEAAVRVLGK
ncbi:MAG: lysophospholipid acyltransferase family protein [Chthoniobacteraceae bacterium]